MYNVYISKNTDGVGVEVGIAGVAAAIATSSLIYSTEKIMINL